MNTPTQRSSIQSLVTATAVSAHDGDVDDDIGRRKIVWILPRADGVTFEYVKRCESCPELHDGSYGSGRFCSSRCARRVGGLAKKRMWDLQHGLGLHSSSSSMASNTNDYYVYETPSAPDHVGPSSATTPSQHCSDRMPVATSRSSEVHALRSIFSTPSHYKSGGRECTAQQRYYIDSETANGQSDVNSRNARNETSQQIFMKPLQEVDRAYEVTTSSASDTLDRHTSGSKMNVASLLNPPSP